MTGITSASLLRGLSVTGLLIAWAWLAHDASAGAGGSDLAVAMASTWMLAIIVILLWRVGKPWWLIAGGLAVVVILPWHWQTLRQNVAMLYYLQHVGTNLTLGLLFGCSLFGQGEALVTRFARLAHHGVLSEAQFFYTRQVTIAWTVFFGATAVLSTVLFVFASPIVSQRLSGSLPFCAGACRRAGQWQDQSAALLAVQRNAAPDQERLPDVVCLCDGDFDSLDLPRLDFPELVTVDAEKIVKIPEIPADLEAAILFTSGSTGLPVAHGKSWGLLVRNGRAEAERLGLLDSPHSIVGTVPAQHSYGFESTVLLALHGNSPFWAGKPFYPQDIVAALDAVPRPRLLVTTPYHLSALISAGMELPAIDLLLSATAPLSVQLASHAETACKAPLYEIYGSTESGQLASRRTTADLAWELLPGVALQQEGDQTFAGGGHVEGRVVLADIIEILANGRFLLHGRHADLINIAGKRTSLAYLNHQMAAIPGVVDAAFFSA
jgi:acyl-coenzyme A synthetase/AMP-(fatty) acid ligase